ncbi:anaerobic sulfatase maturase [Clostridium sp.]|uniref:anaerobic sulfatase maturase n=1 Tax=Clostridium sp. TaxID=1506 RepID=UPI002615B24E|nr:anaerobic sulfatase maturase [Clostridium sp.]
MSISILIKPASSLCNLSCKYCFYKDVAANRESYSNGIMTETTALNIIKNALIPSNKVVSFAFQGGEPTLAGLSYFEYFVEAVNKHNIYNANIQYSIQTNGYTIDTDWAKFFKKNDFLVGISLDGPKEINDELRTFQGFKGTFNRVLKSTNILNKYNVPFNILCVLTAFNAKHINKVYNFYKKQGFNYLQFIPCLEPLESVESPNKYSLQNNDYTYALNTLFKIYKNDYFTGNYTSIRLFDNYIQMILGEAPENCGVSGICSCYYVIEANGDAYPCDFYSIDKYKLGNINENTFLEMRESSISFDFIQESKNLDSKCLNCKHFRLCRGGCKRYRTSSITKDVPFNYFCESYYNFFEENTKGLLEMANEIKRQSLINNNLI